MRHKVLSVSHVKRSKSLSFLFSSAIQCELPRNPQNGRAVYASVSYNSLISYECNYGYMLIGDSVRRCEKDKQWTGAEPHCKGGLDSMMVKCSECLG